MTGMDHGQWPPQPRQREEAWDFMRTPKSSGYCPFGLSLVNGRGIPIFVSKPCGSWFHQPCAVAKAKRHS